MPRSWARFDARAKVSSGTEIAVFITQSITRYDHERRPELRSELASIIDRVADLREHVIVTRHGRPAAVLSPVDEYEALEETAEILSDAGSLAAIEEGRREVERGETVTLADLRRDREQRRAQR
jgi:prevent-host-death family protein